MMIHQKAALLEGAQLLDLVLIPKGFAFRLSGDCEGSGVNAIWGEFFREDRRLELHFQRSLGLVRYHVGDRSASHESYMHELGALDKCCYPGFSEDPHQAFRELTHDVSLAQDFLTGTAAKLRQAAAREAVYAHGQHETLTALCVGDARKLHRMRSCFRQKHYTRVVELARGLKYPSGMTEAERKMVEIAS